MAKLMEKSQKLSHGEVLVEVLLSQVNELRKDKVAGASQAANQDAAGEEAMSGEPAVRLLRVNVR